MNEVTKMLARLVVLFLAAYEVQRGSVPGLLFCIVLAMIIRP